jgi:hypothetical protein
MASAKLKIMSPTHENPRSVDVTGLSDEAVRAVESFVAAFREPANGSGTFRSPDEWCKALRQWAESHRRLDNPVDWSRETIYSGRGE